MHLFALPSVKQFLNELPVIFGEMLCVFDAFPDVLSVEIAKDHYNK